MLEGRRILQKLPRNPGTIAKGNRTVRLYPVFERQHEKKIPIKSNTHTHIFRKRNTDFLLLYTYKRTYVYIYIYI